MVLGGALSRLGAGLAASVLVVICAGPAAAMPDPSGYISNLSVRYDVTADGVIRVTETIDYTLQPHGGSLTRFHDIRKPYPADPDQDQVWAYTNFTASSPSGDLPRLDGPARTVRYVLGYEIRGASRTQGSAAGLQDWPVATARPARIERGSVAVSVPSGVRSASCEAPCSSQVAPDGTAHFSFGQGGLSISIDAARARSGTPGRSWSIRRVRWTSSAPAGLEPVRREGLRRAVTGAARDLWMTIQCWRPTLVRCLRRPVTRPGSFLVGSVRPGAGSPSCHGKTVTAESEGGGVRVCVATK